MNLTDPILNGSLTLADGSCWVIGTEDASKANITNTLAHTMGFKPSTGNSGQMLLVSKNYRSAKQKSRFFHSATKTSASKDQNGLIVCHLESTSDNNSLAIQLMQLSLIFCIQTEAKGGLLIHGGLAEKDGVGIILAGPGEAGKSTASRRLPSPWRSLSDDCTLIVLDKKGTYHAHPWPTWSTFMFGGTGSSWDVQHSVPLNAIFMLSQNDTDYVEFIEHGQAVCMLNESAGQVWWPLVNNLDSEKKRLETNLQRFNNVCKLVKDIPSYKLHISRNGSFWKEIERVL